MTRVTGRNNENHNLGIFVHCFFYSGVQGTADVGELYTEQTPGLGSEKKKFDFNHLGSGVNGLNWLCLSGFICKMGIVIFLKGYCEE